MIIKIYDKDPNPKALAKVVAELEKGSVVILPTDTIYTIACKISSRRGFESLCRIKGLSPKESDFSILSSGISQLSEYAKPMTNQLFRVVKKNLPGPFTFIFEASAKIPKLFGTKRKTIGIRIPDNSVFQAITELLGEPVIGTSIHDDDEIIEYTTDPELIYEKYGHQISLLVDGGYGNNIASTVVDCVEMPPVVIRQGIGDLLL